MAEPFRGKSRVQQNQIFLEALKAEMGDSLHVLATRAI
jgi:stress-induced morphogen